VRPFNAATAPDGTGFAFTEYSHAALRAALKEATAVFADKKVWLQLMHNGMRQDFGWDRSAENYLALYRSLMETGELLP
jgi:starch synthase